MPYAIIPLKKKCFSCYIIALKASSAEFIPLPLCSVTLSDKRLFYYYVTKTFNMFQVRFTNLHTDKKARLISNGTETTIFVKYPLVYRTSQFSNGIFAPKKLSNCLSLISVTLLPSITCEQNISSISLRNYLLRYKTVSNMYEYFSLLIYIPVYPNQKKNSILELTRSPRICGL